MTTSKILIVITWILNEC